jgi:hypothetical protein
MKEVQDKIRLHLQSMGWSFACGSSDAYFVRAAIGPADICKPVIIHIVGGEIFTESEMDIYDECLFQAYASLAHYNLQF